MERIVAKCYNERAKYEVLILNLTQQVYNLKIGKRVLVDRGIPEIDKNNHFGDKTAEIFSDKVK